MKIEMTGNICRLQRLLDLLIQHFHPEFLWSFLNITFQENHGRWSASTGSVGGRIRYLDLQSISVKVTIQNCDWVENWAWMRGEIQFGDGEAQKFKVSAHERSFLTKVEINPQPLILLRAEK